MEGIIYFGRHTINVDDWSDSSNVLPTLRKLSELMQSINSTNYSKSRVPENWYEEPESFFDKVETVLKGQSDLIGQVYSQLFDRAFMTSIFKEKGYLDARDDITNNNPNSVETEYYGAMRLGNEWPDVPSDLHVSSLDELTSFAIKFLIEHPQGEASFLSRCKKIFPNLVFAPDLEGRLKSHGRPSKDGAVKKKRSRSGAPKVTGINGFSNEVTKAFVTLNKLSTDAGTPQEIMHKVKEISGFDCTQEGGNKAHLRFPFVNNSGQEETINCEFHIKIHNHNTPDGVRYEERVYFGFVHIENSRRILIAHSGQHL